MSLREFSLKGPKTNIFQVCSCDDALTPGELVRFQKPVCECPQHVRGIAQMASFGLVEFRHRGEGIGCWSRVDNVAEGLHCLGIGLEKRNFRIARNRSVSPVSLPSGIVSLAGLLPSSQPARGRKTRHTWEPRDTSYAPVPPGSRGRSRRSCRPAASPADSQRLRGRQGRLQRRRLHISQGKPF